MTPVSPLPLIAIVGRPNVGKSALFNRIIRRRVAIVHEESGVTRDRVVAPAEFEGRHFLAVDTGGLGVLAKEKNVGLFDGLIRTQLETALAEAAILVLVVDVQAGLMPLDEEVASLLRRSGKPVVVAANKADNPMLEFAAQSAFASLGFGEVMPVSCLHGHGVGDLLEVALKGMPKAPPPTVTTTPLKIAVIGRPNVGKSSIINRLLGRDRVIVSEVAGTTRDAIDIPFQLHQDDATLPAILIDTAGLRPKSKVDTVVELFSVMRAKSALEHADLVLFVLDVSAPPTSQDRTIAHLIQEARKTCIILANKMDLLPEKMKPEQMEDQVRGDLPFMEYVPILPISALNGEQMESVTDWVFRVHEKMRTTVPTSLLNQFIHDLVTRTPPVAVKGKHFKVFYSTMVGMPPPHLVLFANSRELGTPAYLQFLQSRIGAAFFPDSGMPVWVEVRDRPQREGPPPPRRAPKPVSQKKRDNASPKGRRSLGKPKPKRRS